MEIAVAVCVGILSFYFGKIRGATAANNVWKRELSAAFGSRFWKEG